MTARERATFFGFYNKHKSRRLSGLFADLKKRPANNVALSRYLRRKSAVTCLVVGCSHWANPRDLEAFVRQYNDRLLVTVVALDVLPDALFECVRHNVHCVPLLTPAQATPFLDGYFDIVVADGLLNCCTFDQHQPIVAELHRIAKRNALVLLGLAHSSTDMVVNPPERGMAVHCRPLADFRLLFTTNGFRFIKNSSIETNLSDGGEIKIENCIARIAG